MTDFAVREMRESDLSALFDIQTDAGAQFMAAFTDTSNDREKYLRKWRKLLADEAVRKKVVLADGEVAGSVVSFVMEGETEVTYWIRREYWGRGIGTKALAALLKEVPVRPVFARTAFDNVGSMRVLEGSRQERVDLGR